MLQAAAERKQEGVDVIIGLVETHKRKETANLLTNLKILPIEENHLSAALLS